MNLQAYETSVATLSNAAELVARSVVELNNGRGTTSVNGTTLTLEAVRGLAVARFQNNLKLGASNNAA